jgi:hypothetical protein
VDVICLFTLIFYFYLKSKLKGESRKIFQVPTNSNFNLCVMPFATRFTPFLLPSLSLSHFPLFLSLTHIFVTMISSLSLSLYIYISDTHTLSLSFSSFSFRPSLSLSFLVAVTAQLSRQLLHEGSALAKTENWKWECFHNFNFMTKRKKTAIQSVVHRSSQW